jgi:hypothetical protein
VFSVAVSADCGNSWTPSAILASNIEDPETRKPLGLSSMDRQQTYVDWANKVMYLLFVDLPTSKNVLLRTSATGSEPTPLTPKWTPVAVLQNVIKGLPSLGQASMFAIGSSPDLYVFSCANGLPVLLQLTGTTGPAAGVSGTKIDTSGLPSCGTKTALNGNLRVGSDSLGAPLQGSLGIAQPRPPLVGPSMRLVYTGTKNVGGSAYQVLYVEDVTDIPPLSPPLQILKSSSRTIDESASGNDIAFQDIIWPEGRESATPAPQVLHWTEVKPPIPTLNGPSVIPFTENFSAWASGFPAGPQRWFDIASASKNHFVSNLSKRGTPTMHHYFGDYRYGSYLESTGRGTDEFVSIWTEITPGAATQVASPFGALLEL